MINYKQFKKRLISLQQKFVNTKLNYTDFIKNSKKQLTSSKS